MHKDSPSILKLACVTGESRHRTASRIKMKEKRTEIIFLRMSRTSWKSNTIKRLAKLVRSGGRARHFYWYFSHADTLWCSHFQVVPKWCDDDSIEIDVENVPTPHHLKMGSYHFASSVASPNITLRIRSKKYLFIYKISVKMPGGKEVLSLCWFLSFFVSLSFILIPQKHDLFWCKS